MRKFFQTIKFEDTVVCIIIRTMKKFTRLTINSVLFGLFKIIHRNFVFELNSQMITKENAKCFPSVLNNDTDEPKIR